MEIMAAEWCLAIRSLYQRLHALLLTREERSSYPVTVNPLKRGRYLSRSRILPFLSAPPFYLDSVHLQPKRPGAKLFVGLAIGRV